MARVVCNDCRRIVVRMSREHRKCSNDYSMDSDPVTACAASDRPFHAFPAADARNLTAAAVAAARLRVAVGTA